MLRTGCKNAHVTSPSVILCDLDGTITDSIPGILRCLREALPTIGMEHLTDDQLRTWLGPPLRHTMLEVNGRSEEELDTFVTAYRAHYFGGGEYEFEVFPGMADLIADLGSSEHSLVLATAKPIESAQRVLTRAGLIEYFDFVSGTELDLLRQGKPAVIAYGLTSIGVDPAAVSAVMIGDRKEDVLGAQHFGFDSIGVRWGYADPGELEGVGATHIVDTADELRAVLGL